ncbi:hypothetical protein SEVIR_2G356700v4 [Setaria viridis]|uniref:F-box domain-containing protein n=1 Tax=Setaria viridis TaxID=4556 RepID=A0A4U6W011_SETVI|nr:uncharacterized protein LOC117845097 [Setaria viridis]TKW35202.1 hypothetical protein SEVIR_2G356700v2 [Setaria viridis]
MASPSRPVRRRRKATESQQRSLLALSDDVLEEILLRVGSPADLARASTACVAFRRLIAGPGFLRRYRSLHPPLLLGFLDPGPGGGFQPAEAPHPNAPAARALARAAGFSFDYIPRGRGRRWHPRDVRDGRVLLYCSPDVQESIVFPDLAVCDPVSRRYLLVPRITDELLASVQVQKQHVQFFEAFLVPSGVEQKEEASFRVLGRACCMTKMVALVFSSGSSHWDVGTSESWDDLSLNARPFAEGLMLRWPSYAYGCFYWKVHLRNKVLKLDMSRMKFSIIDLPPGNADANVVIVETGEGRLGMIGNLNHVRGDTHVYYASKNEGDSNNEWRMAKTIPLPEHYNCCLVGAPEGYIFLLGVPKDKGTLGPACFSLGIKTLEIERVSQMGLNYRHVYPYFGFPPSMLPRMI